MKLYFLLSLLCRAKDGLCKALIPIIQTDVNDPIRLLIPRRYIMGTPSTMLKLGTIAPDFSLPDAGNDGKLVSSQDFQDSAGFLVVFMCNHCPYVRYIGKALADFAKEYQPKGLAIVGINANDVADYPDDSPDKMAEEVVNFGYTFPYLFDQTQEVAKAYRAACTPDFFLFDKKRKLVYRGRFDASLPKSDTPVTGQDLRAAADALLSGQTINSTGQKASFGCNIKWKQGNEPDYFRSIRLKPSAEGVIGAEDDISPQGLQSKKSKIIQEKPVSVDDERPQSEEEPAKSSEVYETEFRGQMTELREQMAELKDELGQQRALMKHEFGRIGDRFKVIGKHFDVADKHFKAIDKRFQTVDKHFEVVQEDMQKQMNERLAVMEERFDGLSKHNRLISWLLGIIVVAAGAAIAFLSV